MTDQTAEAVIWLIETKGLSVNQVARQMNLTPSGVNSAIQRARKATEGRVLRKTIAGISAGSASYRPVHIEDNSPCGRCGTRRDRHEGEMFKHRWRPGP